MAETTDFKPGLEGVVAVETEIAEPDREGGVLRYRGVDIEELARMLGGSESTARKHAAELLAAG